MKALTDKIAVNKRREYLIAGPFFLILDFAVSFSFSGSEKPCLKAEK